MRIIAGSLKHRPIPSPPGDQTRPTTDRGRETLFHVLSHHIHFEGLHVLDLYAGSGALSFECLSRGAVSATLVDRSADVCKHLRATAFELSVSDSITIVRADAEDFMRNYQNINADLIFVDPPYALKVCNTIARLVSARKVLREHGLVVFEHSDQEHLLANDGLEHMRTIELGQTVFSLYRRVDHSL